MSPSIHSDSNQLLALSGGTIYIDPAALPIADGLVLIEGETIAAVGSRREVQIPAGAQILDCTGLTIAAGFWNSHVHFFERKWADAARIPASELSSQFQDFTRYGFTSVFDLSSQWENTRRLRERIESGEVAGPGIRTVGEGLVPPGAVPSEPVLNFMGLMKTPLPEIATTEQAAAASRKLLEEGVDGIKVFAASPRSEPISESVIRAAVQEAHRFGKPAFLHPNTASDVLTAARAGVDVIAHTTPHSGLWDETILASMTEARVAVTPTLALWKYFMRHDRISAQEQAVTIALGQLRSWHSLGGQVLFGTDLGAIDCDPGNEYVLMKDAGLSFPEILDSLTTAPAKRFGESHRLGRIAAGLQADLVALKGDPTGDLRALSAVQFTLRSGKIIYSTSLPVTLFAN